VVDFGGVMLQLVLGDLSVGTGRLAPALSNAGFTTFPALQSHKHTHIILANIFQVNVY